VPLAIQLIGLLNLLLIYPSAVHCGSHVENLGTRAGGTEPRATHSLGSGINWGFRSPSAKDTGNLRAMSDSFSMIAAGPALRLLTDVADFHFSDIPVRGDDGARAIGANEPRGRRRQHP
jgi:hypothetical protein